MSKPPYDVMRERHDVLERLDIRVRWGRYDIKVLRFHLTTFEPGRIVQFHQHNEYEFHFIPGGKGKVVLVDRPYALREGMLYLTGPGVMHCQEADAEEAMHELCLHVDITERPAAGDAGIDHWEVAEADDCIRKLDALPLAPAMDLYEAMPHFLEAYRACISDAPGRYTTIRQHVVQILLKAARAYDAPGTPRTELPSRDMKTYRYRLALEYMRANYAGVVTLEGVAEKLNISARQLQRILKDVRPDSSFSGLLEDIRMEAVCARLAESEQSVERIAAATGFTSGNYLHAVFRKRFGMTPSAYRLQHQLSGGMESWQRRIESE